MAQARNVPAERSVNPTDVVAPSRRQHTRTRRPARRLRDVSRSVLESLERRSLLNATFFPRVDYPVTDGADFVALADLNGDAIQDMIVSSYGGSLLSVRMGRSDGTFQSASNVPLSVAPDYVAAADLNGDGKTDLIAAHFDNNTISVLVGNGNGSFGSATSYSAGAGPRAFTMGDFNGDGHLDLLMAKTFDKKLTLLRGNGNGTFQSPVNYTISFTPTVVVAGDFNNDGKLDVAASDFYTDKVHLSLGNGDGTFQTAVAISVGAGPSDLTTGDFNGDGKLDLATANFLGNNVSVLRGNGSGTFLAAVNYSAGNGATALVAADLNGDGKLDLAVANAHSDTVTALAGSGTGIFTLDATFNVGDSPRAIAAARLNGDASPDLAVTNQGSSNVSVLLAVPPSTSPPVAHPGGPYVVNEGGVVQLNGGGSTGGDLTYLWDLDGDGVFGETGSAATRGDEVGATPTFRANGLDGPSTRAVSLRVSNSSGTQSAGASVYVANVAPTLVISGPSSAAAGAVYTLNLSATDPGGDTITRWVINWGDGLIQTITGNPSSATHTYSSGGVTRTISATASDEDGTWSSNSLSVVISSSDTTHPTAKLKALNLTSFGGSTHRFTVTYDDNVGINLAFLDNNDILVTGPNGFSQLARFVSVVAGTGNARIATYEITAPGGTWDMADVGTYTVYMQKAQVRDTTGNSVRQGTLGTFVVLPPDSAGNDLVTAMDLGTMTPGRISVVDEWVGTLDRNDFYKLTISSPGTLKVKLFNLTQNADLMLLDSAANRIVYLKKSGTAIEEFARSVTPGTYYVRVLFAGTAGTGYRLRLETPSVGSTSDDNSMQTARDAGTINPGTIRNFDGYVGPDDRNDFYRITITQSIRLDVRLTGLADNADLMLLDSAGNRLAYSYRAGHADESFQLSLGPGTYYIRVLFTSTTGTAYRLRLEGMQP